MSVAVVGGGLAGITAALALADAGRPVSLYEGRGWLGGLTHSFRRGDLVDTDGGLAALITFSAQRARGWYDDGLRLIPLLDRRSAACAAAMSGIYRRLLRRIAAQPASVYGQRLSVPRWEKAAVAARALTGLSR